MEPKKNKIWLWLIVGLLMLGLFNLFAEDPAERDRVEITYSQFLKEIEIGSIQSVTINGEKITGTLGEGVTAKGFKTYAPYDPNLVPNLIEKKIHVKSIPKSTGSIWSSLLGWLPIIVIAGVWIFFMRRMGNQGSQMLGIGKSKAKLLVQKTPITFKDVAGCDEAKQEVQEIVEYLRDPTKFTRLGGKMPKGILLVGAPGTGKTLLARAIAGEAEVPFFHLSGSDFVEMFVGVGAARVRDLFKQAKENSPCIIFIDEIDAVGRKRGAGLGGGNDEREQTLNQLLVEMDGFEVNESVILISATNRPDVLDPALTRPGRFDRQVVVPVPDVLGREQILKIHLKPLPVAPNVDPRVIARGTPGFTGADLANLCNEAALLAARKNQLKVTQVDLEEAKDKVMMGTERRSMVMTEEEKKLTAYHEAGHALVGLNVKGNDPLHKVTIIPRGRSLGLTMNLPEKDKYTYKKSELLARLAMSFGGRAAEELIFGKAHITSGAAGDIQQATSIARRMVTELGMSDKVGPVDYGSGNDEIFLGEQLLSSKSISDDMANLIDAEVRRFIDKAEKKAKKILTDKIEDLHTIAKALLDYETLDGKEVAALLKGETIREDEVVEVDNETGEKTTRTKKPKTRRSLLPITKPAIEGKTD